MCKEQDATSSPGSFLLRELGPKNILEPLSLSTLRILSILKDRERLKNKTDDN